MGASGLGAAAGMLQVKQFAGGDLWCEQAKGVKCAEERASTGGRTGDNASGGGGSGGSGGGFGRRRWRHVAKERGRGRV